jgi:UDP:flavonoid glycosyltransferase YjiC (YdhE family)
MGKNHLAIALGREACRRGRRVKFFTASHLVNTYLEAREQRQVMRLEATSARKTCSSSTSLDSAIRRVTTPTPATGLQHRLGRE